MDASQTERTESLHTVQVGKRSSVTGIVNWGPVHVWNRAYRLTWCGRRMRGGLQRGRRAESVLAIGNLCPGCSRALSTRETESGDGVPSGRRAGVSTALCRA